MQKAQLTLFLFFMRFAQKSCDSAHVTHTKQHSHAHGGQTKQLLLRSWKSRKTTAIALTPFTHKAKLRAHSCRTLNIHPPHFPANNRIETI